MNLAADFDEDPIGPIDHDVGDVVARQQRLQRAIAQHVIDDVLDQVLLLGHRHGDILDRHQFGDDVADLFGRGLGIELGQLRQVDGVQQGVEDRRLGRVVIVRLLTDDLGDRLGLLELLEALGRARRGRRL